MEYVGSKWKLSSTDTGLQIQRERTWSNRPTDPDELKAIKGCRIIGAFYDESQNAMIFLLESEQKSRWMLFKVAQESAGVHEGQVRYHSMSIGREDFQCMMDAFHAGTTDK